MAALTGTDYIALVKQYVGADPDSAHPDRIYTDANILAAGNAAYVRFLLSFDNDTFKKSATRNLTAAAMVFPTDCIGNYTAVLYQTGSTTQRTLLNPSDAEVLDIENPGWRDQTGTVPTNYVLYWDGDNATPAWYLQFWPAVTATITSGLKERYTYRPAAITTTLGSDLIYATWRHREPYIIPYGALSQLAFDEAGAADEQAGKWENLFQRQVAGARSDLTMMLKGDPTYKRTW